MPQYVDGFVIPVPLKKLAKYKRIAAKAAKIWREHGALQYMECAGDDLNVPGMLPFAKGVPAKKGETVVFSFIVYSSKAHRNRVNALVMKDPRIHEMCDPKDMPFDGKRMLYGGFKVMVQL